MKVYSAIIWKTKEWGIKTIANKLMKRHINYKNEIMTVRLAALSESVHTALIYCKENDINFNECLATAEFCYFLNFGFDILNSRSKFCQ